NGQLLLAQRRAVDEHQRPRALFVPRDGPAADAPDGRLGLARLHPAPELGPGTVPVLRRDHPLRVGEPEALVRPLAERLFDAFDHVAVAFAPGANELLRLLAVPLEVEPSWKLVVHHDPSSVGRPVSARLGPKEVVSSVECFELSRWERPCPRTGGALARRGQFYATISAAGP